MADWFAKHVTEAHYSKLVSRLLNLLSTTLAERITEDGQGSWVPGFSKKVNRLMAVIAAMEDKLEPESKVS